jgi:predicted anti-sigma-YlaC factor YlaD
MDCETAREAISAVMDGEAAGVPAADLDAHMEGCGACRAWREAAHQVTRRARISAAPAPPRRTSEVVAAVQARARMPRRRPRLVMAARAGLIAVAAGQIAVTVPVLLFGRDLRAPEHIAHEIGSFGAALAVGFLVAAWRPVRALGMRPVVGVAAVLLAVTAVADLVSRRTSLGDEAPHLLAIVGWLLICYLAAACPPAAGGPRLRVVRPIWSLMAGLAARGLGDVAGVGATARFPARAHGQCPAPAGPARPGRAALPREVAGEMTRERAVG